MQSYIKRLATIEEIAMSYRGVGMFYAIQAGRELRVMTKADIVSDLDAHQLAKDITKRIEAEMQYPGHIKVVVIRETRAVEVAKQGAMKIMMVSDVYGRPGRAAITKLLPR